MITTMNTSSQQFEDPMVLLSQVYSSGLYTEATVPQQGESKPRRRRRKNYKAVAAGAESDILGMKKRKLSEEQVKFLEMSFDDEHKLESDRKDKLALELGLDPRQVAVWFQNRRARWKNKKLEEEYNKLKSAHENVVVEKCRLETEILKLKEQLGEAENEIRRLSGPSCVDGAITSNSPTSSLSMGAVDPPFLGEFGVDMDGYDDVFYMQANSYMNGMDWFNMYM